MCDTRVVSRRGPPRCVAGRARRRRSVVDDARRRRDEARRGREEAEAPAPKSRVGRGEARAVVARRSRSRRPAGHLRRHGTAAGEDALALYGADGATLDDLREAVTMLEETMRTARRLLGGANPLAMTIERSLRNARAALRAREDTQP